MEVLFSNRRSFLITGWLRLIALLVLASLLFLLFMGTSIIPRDVFVLLVLLHVAQMIFFPVNYLFISSDAHRQLIRVEYARRFHLLWKKAVVTAEFPWAEIGGIEIKGRWWQRLSIYRDTPVARYALGPFSIGPGYSREHSLLAGRLDALRKDLKEGLAMANGVEIKNKKDDLKS